MSKPIVFKTIHRIRFSDLDLYHHMSTARYAAYYADWPEPVAALFFEKDRA